ncbi:MAG: bifunctional NAD(P)/FAD-dependent oxidoreductase/class I SAM-dependent methyltransferase [Actinomycetota bacterium]
MAKHQHQHQTTGPPAIERHADVVVLGGSAAGLAAALQLGRQRRSVIVVDAGEPRNAPAAAMHGYLGHEGAPPSDLLAIGRDEVRRYGVEVLDGRALGLGRDDDDRFTVELAGGSRVIARRALLATGLVDELPDIEGLRDHWGGAVIHCPFCHGFEVRDRRIVAIITSPLALHPVVLFHRLAANLTLVLHAGVDVDDPEVERFRAAGVEVVDRSASRLVSDPDGHLVAVELDDGTQLDADVVTVMPGIRVRAEVAEPLGLRATPHPSGVGDVIETDPTGLTAVAGLYAAGNVTDPSQQVLHAAANGSRVGAMISFSLAEDDLAAGSGSVDRRAPNESDWDHRYGGDPVWSGNPNGALVAEVADLEPGRVLDVGAGEGGDALWLAERGWAVTATDVSRLALDRIAAEAGRRSLDIAYRHADANGDRPYAAAAFDLVSAHYPSIPRTPEDRAVANLLGAVATGGTLLVVGHDLEERPATNGAGAGEGEGGGDGEGDDAGDGYGDHERAVRAFDPAAYVGIDHVAASVVASSDWVVEIDERRPRPAGAASHHRTDRVFRARRIAGP